jgi:hypothetical protein
MKFFSYLLIFFMTSSLGIAQEQISPFMKDQRRSTTKWGEVDFKTFLSLKDWINQRDEKDATPKWETIVRERSSRETVGRFFQCVGTCRIDRGQSFFNPNFRTSLLEGDEIQTIGESYAWIFLFDGTMVRLSPESSINLNEINIGIKENFISARINAGNVLWLSRLEAPFEESNNRETDVLFNPLVLYEAIPTPEHKKYVESDLIEMVEEKQTTLNQYKKLNSLIEKNNKMTKGKKTYTFIVMPNATLMGYNPNVEVVSLMGGKTFFKKRTYANLGLQSKEAIEEETYIQKRGFEKSDLTPVESGKWLEVDEKGRSLTTAVENLNWLVMGEFMTKRIPSLLVARELLLEKYSEFCFRESYDPTSLASNEGYRLWGALSEAEDVKSKSDLSLRLEFLKEYFRRIETTNLLVSTHFNERLKARGESLKASEYGNYFFIKALDKYYSYEDYSDEKESGEILNSTTKELWKRMHGIK